MHSALVHQYVCVTDEGELGDIVLGRHQHTWMQILRPRSFKVADCAFFNSAAAFDIFRVSNSTKNDDDKRRRQKEMTTATIKERAVETATYVAGKVDPFVPAVAKVGRSSKEFVAMKLTQVRGK